MCQLAVCGWWGSLDGLMPWSHIYMRRGKQEASKYTWYRSIHIRRDARNMQIREANRCSHNVYVRLNMCMCVWIFPELAVEFVLTPVRVTYFYTPVESTRHRRNGFSWIFGQMHVRYGAARRVAQNILEGLAFGVQYGGQIRMLITRQRTYIGHTPLNHLYVRTLNCSRYAKVHMSWTAGEKYEVGSVFRWSNRVRIRVASKYLAD
jgi:hypothetical protein